MVCDSHVSASGAGEDASCGALQAAHGVYSGNVVTYIVLATLRGLQGLCHARRLGAGAVEPDSGGGMAANLRAANPAHPTAGAGASSRRACGKLRCSRTTNPTALAR